MNITETCVCLVMYTDCHYLKVAPKHPLKIFLLLVLVFGYSYEYHKLKYFFYIECGNFFETCVYMLVKSTFQRKSSEKVNSELTTAVWNLVVVVTYVNVHLTLENMLKQLGNWGTVTFLDHLSVSALWNGAENE